LRQEFHTHGFIDNITLTHRNVCKDGFSPAADIDAVFLDLPAPWLAVPHLSTVLNVRTLIANQYNQTKPFGFLQRQSISRVCCYSPCMEQVTKTVAALNEHGFSGKYPKLMEFYIE
jgi:tRNA (adenine57-N1/adenine58-N1)-methyltransferase